MSTISSSTYPVIKVAYCKLLLNRDQYVSCHINVSDLPQRLPAIAVDGKFYSFFKVILKAQKALEAIAKLTQKGDEIALTASKRGYVLWVYEPESKPAPPKKLRLPPIPPIFGPAPCSIVQNLAQLERCHLKVADMAQQLVGIKYQGALYSLFRKEQNAQTTLEIAAKLTKRDDEVILVVAKDGYAIFILEPTAIETQ